MDVRPHEKKIVPERFDAQVRGLHKEREREKKYKPAQPLDLDRGSTIRKMRERRKPVG